MQSYNHDKHFYFIRPGFLLASLKLRRSGRGQALDRLRINCFKAWPLIQIRIFPNQNFPKQKHDKLQSGRNRVGGTLSADAIALLCQNLDNFFPKFETPYRYLKFYGKASSIKMQTLIYVFSYCSISIYRICDLSPKKKMNQK